MPSQSHKVTVNEEPISVSDIHLFQKDTGAEIVFLGIVRDTEDGLPISGIEYSAYEDMAEKTLLGITEAAEKAFLPHRALIRHRIGFVPVGEPSLAIIVATRHSAASFEICQFVLSQIKRHTPIWKRPVFLPPRSK